MVPMRIPLALTILFFLMALATLESVLSFLISIFLGRTVEFPLIQWFLLFIEWIGNVINKGLKLFFLALAAFTTPAYARQLFDAFLEYVLLLLEIFPIIFFPLTSMLGYIPLLSKEGGLLDLLSFMISGIAILYDIFFNPPEEGEETRDDRLNRLFGRRGG
jgi:hypothetical protein